jgi:hypothetical protein
MDCYGFLSGGGGRSEGRVRRRPPRRRCRARRGCGWSLGALVATVSSPVPCSSSATVGDRPSSSSISSAIGSGRSSDTAPGDAASGDPASGVCGPRRPAAIACFAERSARRRSRHGSTSEGGGACACVIALQSKLKSGWRASRAARTASSKGSRPTFTPGGVRNQ